MPGLFIFFVIIVGVVYVLARSMDTDRVSQYIQSQGGQLIDKTWDPFGPAWVGDKRDRIYQIRYLDRQGNEHLAHCKTSLFSGVHMTDDQIVRWTVTPEDARSRDIELENQRLREEVQRLEEKQG